MKNFSRSFFALCFFTHSFAFASSFHSDIFSFDDPTNAKGLHVFLPGGAWNIREIQEKDTDFHVALFTNPLAMQQFGNGRVRPIEAVKARIKNSIEDRFQKGHPNGMIVAITQEGQPFMHLIAQGGLSAGESYIACAVDPAYWRQGWGKDCVRQSLKLWAPEVSRIGRGQGLNHDVDQNIITAFNCFGGSYLQFLTATVAPSNIGSLRIILGAGFTSDKKRLPIKMLPFHWIKRNSKILWKWKRQ